MCGAVWADLLSVWAVIRVMGDVFLFNLMLRCAELIKRDIVFAASLYIA